MATLAPKIPAILYGGDWCPEQWPREVWREDMRLMKAAGVNLATLNVFNWVRIQPREDEWTFAWLDEAMDLLAGHGIFADLGTANAAPPAWMSRKNPDMLPVDDKGQRFHHGSRQTICPNSQVYRMASNELVRRIAERYRAHPALAMWHVNNEIGHGVDMCHCGNCQRAFGTWLEARYGSIERVNQVWGTEFWGQNYGDWAEIPPPLRTSAQINSGLLLDYRRFMTDSWMRLYRDSAAILRAVTPAVPVTTNFLYEKKRVDYALWGEHLDFVSISAFPDPATRLLSTHEAELNFAMMRGIKHGAPFLLMEQAANNVAWRDVNASKRPGQMRLWSYTALAHGSDGALFFQWRQSSKGAEKFHSAMVPHAGEDSRVFREVARLGNELKALAPVCGTRCTAEVALLLDYQNWWAVEYPRRISTELRYDGAFKPWFYALRRQNLPVDVVWAGGDLSRHRLVVAPMLHLVRPGIAEQLERFVAAGGTLVVTYWSGIVDETDTVFAQGYPGPLARLLGLRVEEVEALPKGEKNRLLTGRGDLGLAAEYPASLWAELVHPTTAEVLARLSGPAQQGSPCLTVNRHGQGRAYYLATQLGDDALRDLVRHLAGVAGVAPIAEADEQVEVVRRSGEQGEFLFVLNHRESEGRAALPPGTWTDLVRGATCSGELRLGALDVAVLRRS